MKSWFFAGIAVLSAIAISVAGPVAGTIMGTIIGIGAGFIGIKALLDYENEAESETDDE